MCLGATRKYLEMCSFHTKEKSILVFCVLEYISAVHRLFFVMSESPWSNHLINMVVLTSELRMLNIFNVNSIK